MRFKNNLLNLLCTFFFVDDPHLLISRQEITAFHDRINIYTALYDIRESR